MSFGIIKLGSSGSGGGAYVEVNTIATAFAMSTNSVIATTSDQRQHWYIKSGGGQLNITSNPTIDPGTIIGQEMLLQGCDDSNTVRFQDGNGMRLNGDCVFRNNSHLYLIWNGNTWLEITRNDI